MPDTRKDELFTVVAEAWHRWPEKSAASSAARRGHVRRRLSGELTFAPIEASDTANGTNKISEEIDRILAAGEPRSIN